MSLLSYEEIERLKKTHPVKYIFRILFLILGFFIVFIGFVFFVIRFDFRITIDEMNISFIADILIIIIGLIIASKFFIAPYYLRENSLTIKKMRDLREPVDSFIKFNSIAITRFLAALLLVIVGLISLQIFGLDVGHEVKYGSAVVLGGPSFFYISGLPALGIGFGLLLYFFLSPFRGTFSQSSNFYFFYEVRPFCPWLTEIPKKDIEGVRYQNNHLGPKIGWIMLLLPFIVTQLMIAIPLFMIEKSGPNYTLSWVFLLTSLCEIIALILLVMFQQNYFEIATSSHLYEMWFSPIKLRGRKYLRQKLANYLKCIVDESEFESDLYPSLFENISNTHFQLFNLIFGAFLIIPSIIMIVNMVLFGPLFWWIALMYGFILLVKSFSYDFSKKRGDFFYYNEKKKKFKFKRSFSYKFQYIISNNIKSVKIRKWFRKLDFFDFFGIGGIMIMLIIQQIEGWAIIDSLPQISDNIISTIYMTIILILIFFFVCLPVDVIELQSPTIVYRIPVTLKKDNQTLLQKYIKSIKGFMQDISKEDMIWVFIIRLSVIVMLIVGSVFYTLFNLVIFFT